MRNLENRKSQDTILVSKHNFSENYIEMVSKSRKRFQVNKEVMEVGDYFYTDESKEILLCISEFKITDETLIPTVTQILQKEEVSEDFKGSVRFNLSNSSSTYYFPNKEKSYPTYEEFFFATFMYRDFKEIWVNEKKGDKVFKSFNWYSENALLKEKLGIEKNEEEFETRIVPIFENGVFKEFKTEKYKYDFENNKIEIIE